MNDFFSRMPARHYQHPLRKPCCFRRTVLLAGMVFLLTGCSVIQETPQERAQRIEPMLSAAGFHMIPADNEKKMSVVNSIPPYELGYYVGKSGKPHYWFVDPDNCKCVYKGDETAYQNYQNLKVQQQIAQEQLQAARLNQDAAMQMNMYDPYWFPY